MEERRTEDLYRRAEQQLSEVAAAVQRQDPIDLDQLSELGTAIGEAVRHNDRLVVHAMSGPLGPPLITNLVNVAVISAKVGAGLGYYGEELQRLVLAGLVHDIGLFVVPPSVVTKSGRLTQDERTLIEQHPELGYQVIRKAGPEWEWLAQVVRQAHERWNGQGYPNRLKGRQISELAQIIGVVDVFDALVTPRPYRRRFFPHEAVRELIVAERTAFPREIVKALVEQLSAYPLGTLVRLTTGETGTVVRINAEFPLRPVVQIGTGEGSEQETHELDLSRAPLVSVIETLEPPDVARVPSGRLLERRTKSSVSEHFSSLLESLDAIASAIQGVVESRTISPQDSPTTFPSGVTRSGAGRSAVPDHGDAAFEKEVIGLFALEAHEWLGQIHSALRQLDEGANGSMRPKLYGIMLQGLTNLAKSAATVRQTSIEHMATSLLPILHEAGTPESRAMQPALASLQAGLDRIAAAVRHAAGERGAEQSPLSQRDKKVASEPDPETHKVPGVEDQAASSIPSGVSGNSLLKALRELQSVRSRSMQPTRDVLESVIQMAEGRPGDLTVPAVRDILVELDRTDEEFLHEINTRVPVMSRTLTHLQQQGAADFVTASQLDPIVEQVEALYEAAGRVQAGTITMFLQGLRSFLLVAAYRKTVKLAERLDSMQERIQALVPMAEQWVEVGRVERTAIADILPQ
ncbi:MAG TPA: HD-GYP domain-containing protein [Nitrospira sp.]|nr:HD-GYP domain-containing protein [Nitrospira sp.]